jgi:hypothetical protein
MTDAVIVALIAAVPGTIAALIGMANRNKLNDVSHNVDGNLLEIKQQLAKVTAERLTLTQESSHALGMKEEKDKERT